MTDGIDKRGLSRDDVEDLFADRPVSRRRPIVGVMGSGSDEHDDLAAPLGRLLARMGVHLLTGGGPGVMSAVSRAFAAVPDRGGLVLGVLPGRVDDSGRLTRKPGYPHPYLEVPIQTHLWHGPGEEAGPTSRNHVNVLTSDAVVALPGSAGTASEVRMAVRYGKPVIAYVPEGEAIPGLAETGVERTGDLDRVEAFLRRSLGVPDTS